MKPKIRASPSFVPLALIFGSIVGLAVMGLAFCWADSDRLHDIGSAASRYYFNRQAIWNVLGLTAFCMAIIVGWKRWLKVAPFVFVGWVALWSVAHMREFVAGSSTIVLIGPISLEVWALFPVAFALLVAWLRQRYGVQTKRILFIVGIAAFAAITVHVFTNANRMTHLAAFFAGEESPAMSPAACARAFVQSQTCKAFAQAQWFSSTNTEILRDTPGNRTYSMPASSAVLLGKWFMSVAWVFSPLSHWALLTSGVEREIRRNAHSFLSLGWELSFQLYWDIVSALGSCRCYTQVFRLFRMILRPYWRRGLAWAFSFRPSLMRVNPSGRARTTWSNERCK